MTNDEYRNSIKPYIDSIEQSITDNVTLSKEVIGDSLLDIDLCFIGLLDRSIQLSKGFIQMIQSRNLTCSGALLRLMIDNCLRLYAISIAEDEKQAIDAILEGKQINKLKDKNGNKMNDGYLKTELGKFDSRLVNVYDNASGYIHFSSKAFYQTIENVDDISISFRIGSELPERRNEVLIECASAYDHYFKLFLHMMNSEAEWEKNFDDQHEEEKE